MDLSKRLPSENCFVKFRNGDRYLPIDKNRELIDKQVIHVDTVFKIDLEEVQIDDRRKIAVIVETFSDEVSRVISVYYDDTLMYRFCRQGDVKAQELWKLTPRSDSKILKIVVTDNYNYDFESKHTA